MSAKCCCASLVWAEGSGRFSFFKTTINKTAVKKVAYQFCPSTRRRRTKTMAVDRSSLSFSSDTVVIKAPNDKRLYRVLHLRNGLSAILIHDPEVFADGVSPFSKTLDNGDVKQKEEEDEEEDEEDDDEDDEDEDDEDDDEDEGDDEDDDELNEKKTGGPPPTKKAAAALCVGMGSFSDPFEAQGLAHFLEHMLFMGSSEFPDENEYDSYLSKHGGSSNAYTEVEYTCYYFEVNREFLKGALKRFSQFFVSPLVKSEAMEREVLAVDSGNKKSLVDAMEKGLNLREQILQLYKENYHGGVMKLVVIGGESLDMLEDWVLELFSNVKEGKQLKPEAQINVPIWKGGKLYRLEAVKDIHSVNLTWTLPPLKKEYLKKPEDYLAHLLGHEGRGSLHSFLKAEGWITSLSAGVGDEGMDRSSVAYIYNICINLTDSGLEKVYDVIGIVYQYIKLLRQFSPQKWLFTELQDIGNMEFKFAEEQAQDDYAAELAANLFRYSEEHVICGDYVYDIWDENLITHVLSFLTPENMRIDVLSKSFNKLTEDVQFEPWFGSRFSEEDVAESLLELWRDPPKINPSLHLPSKNEFIPHDFSIRENADASKSHASNRLPYCLIDQPLLKLWYKLDETFRVPRANTYFLVTVKGGYNTVKSCVLMELFVTLLKDELNEILYQAGVAKLETSMSIVGDKLELKLYGFNDKLPALLSKILTIAKSFTPAADRFEVIKEVMKRSYRNANIKPLNHSSYLRLQVLRKDFWDVDDKLQFLIDSSLADLKAFIPKLLSQLHIESLCHGNLSREEAIEIADIFKRNFPVEPLPVEFRHEERVLCLPSAANLARDVCVKNKLEENSVVELYYQIEQDIGLDSTKLRALADLFEDIVQEPLFDQLRTKEQLGYVVECGVRVTYRVLGFCFRVQSSKYDPVYLHGRIENFINGVQELLHELDIESFDNYRNCLIAKKLEKDPSLSDETSHLWGQIVDKRYLFDMCEKEAELLKSICKNDVVEWYNTYLKPTSPNRRTLAVRVWGCNTNMKEVDSSHLEPLTFIEDLALFKKSAEFYSSLC